MDRRLVLLRHAKSAWPADVPDHERPLARRGQRDAPAVGRWLRQSGCVPDQVLCSTARRAVQTWQLAQSELAVSPPESFDSRVYGAVGLALRDLVRQVSLATTRTLLVVGHAPGIPDLALMLAGHANDGAAGERLAVKFPTAAVAVLEFAGDWAELDSGAARLTSFVIPSELR